MQGSTVTGWIDDDPTLSATGTYTPYSSPPLQFAALYPETWTAVASPPASVVFGPPGGGETVVVTTAPAVAAFERGRSGYHQISDEAVVVCGVSGDLVTYVQVSTPTTTTTGPAPSAVTDERYLAEVRLTLDAQNALGIDANFSDLSLLPTIRNVISSISFPFPVCE